VAPRGTVRCHTAPHRTATKCELSFSQRAPVCSGGATPPGRARSNDLAGRSTALVPPYLLL